MMTNQAQLFQVARDYYDAIGLVRSFVDLHYILSLKNASIDPEPAEEWLEALADVVLDYWKAGESFLGSENGCFAFCDPSEIELASGATPTGGARNFVFPASWVARHEEEPFVIINRTNPYDLRGYPLAYKQMVILSSLRQSGMPQTIDADAFGFYRSNPRVVDETIAEIRNRVMAYRRKLGQAINHFWPDCVVDFYPIGLNTIRREAQALGLLR